MTTQKDRITAALGKIGAAWAVTTNKCILPDDPMENQINQVKTYHIHPDQVYPYSNSIQRFHSLRELEDWIQEQLNREESLGFLAKLYKMDVSTLSRHAGGKLTARKSGKAWLSTRRAVEEYLAKDGRRKENR